LNFYEAIIGAVLTGDEKTTVDLVKKALAQGLQPQAIINQALVVGINAVGDRYKSGEYFIPEMLCGAKAMQKGMEYVKPLIQAEVNPCLGKVVIGTVAGDIHDIGKNIVAIMLEAAGFQVYDLGCDVSPQAFAAAVKEHEADLLGMSALLTTTMFSMKKTLDELQEQGLREKVKVMIGGAVVNQDFAVKIGADGYAGDSAAAVDLAKSLIGQRMI
jgi:5-methyltetrahydrofolate--homocysteine methyltransferase